MAMNRVQFQAGLSMPAFMAQYGTEAKCRRALFRSRWPRGFRCPACEQRSGSRFRRERQIYYQCRACRHQTTLLSGTLFEATKLPLSTWFLAIHLLTSTKTNMAALELKCHLGGSYAPKEVPLGDRTAWRLKHKVMEAMTQREEPRQLSGFVQIDDATLGGEHNGDKPGRGLPNKPAFVIAVETDEHLEHPRFAVIEPGARSTTRPSPTGRHVGWTRKCRRTPTAWAPSAASPTLGMRNPCSKRRVVAPRPKCAVPAGSTCCFRT